MNNVLVTGGAGFIGSHLVDRLLDDGCEVTVLDNFDPSHERAAKERNIASQRCQKGWRLVEGDVRDLPDLRSSLDDHYDCIVHLAARSGARQSIADPVGFQDVNVRGTQNLLEFARQAGVPQFVFASSSSVYGLNPRMPWSEDDHGLQPISPYASTKVSGELLGHVYSRLHGIRFVALRLFSVYGPRQRPDLAIYEFARSILQGQPIQVFGDGSTQRDYTYIDDVVDGIWRAMRYKASPFEVVNLGNDRSVTLVAMIRRLERALNCAARLEWLPLQAGDVPQAWANIDKARALFSYHPSTSFDEGIERFADWYHSRTPAFAAVRNASARA